MESGFQAEADSVDQVQWDEITRDFADANILQSWSYGIARNRRRDLSHLLLKRNGRVVAATLVRMAGFPRLGLGLAYVRWGPLWRRRGSESDPEVFRQMIRAMRNEYTARRGLVIRLLPSLYAQQDDAYSNLLASEGYQAAAGNPQYRTILMDVSPSLETLERGLHSKWRKHLNRARKNGLEIVEGEDDALLLALGATYEEMARRKGLSTKSDLEAYRATQRSLPVGARMRVILCKFDGQVVAGALFSALGDTAVDLFRATSDVGVKCYGSYLVQWKVIEHLKQKGCHWYNLNSVNPLKNPGGYQFKSQLGGKHGRDVYFLGPYDSLPNSMMKVLLGVAEKWRNRRTQRLERSQETLPKQQSDVQGGESCGADPEESRKTTSSTATPSESSRSRSSEFSNADVAQ